MRVEKTVDRSFDVFKVFKGWKEYSVIPQRSELVSHLKRRRGRLGKTEVCNWPSLTGTDRVAESRRKIIMQ